MGQHQVGDRESPGQYLGRRVMEVLHKQRMDYTEDDIACLRRVISDIYRYRTPSPGYSSRDWNQGRPDAKKD